MPSPRDPAAFRSPRPLLALLLAILAAASLTAVAYWPGLMTWDAIRQYGQALDGAYDDWHPPAMDWVWRQLARIHAGPAPMLILQLALYWSGFALLAVAAWRRGRSGLAVAVAAVGLLPLGLALMGAVLKDCLMAGLLLAASGALAFADAGGQRTRRLVAAAGFALLLAAATLRFNAFLACVPLAVALLPARLRASRPRLALVTAIMTLLFLLPLPVANRLLGAARSGVELSLVIFDLGGITRESGIDQFPPLPIDHPIADPVAANRQCYSPVKWDPYSNWVDPVCPLGFDAFRGWLAHSHASAEQLWIAAIVRHPLAYAVHRLHHFNIATRFLVHDPVERAVQRESAPNDWHYRVTPNPLLTGIDTLAVASAATPLGWPFAGIALALGVLLVGVRLPSARLIVPLATSSLLYGLGYAVVGVAAELRYHLWTLVAALLAAVLAAGDLGRMPDSRRPLLIAAAPLAVTLTLAVGYRLLTTG